METIELTTNHLQTISWLGDKIVDWGSAGTVYSLDGSIKRLWQEHFTLNFDGSINSEDGKYAFIYQKNGTKGLLLKQGKLLREINRPYYCAEVYEYPAAFVTIANATYLIHCPLSYKQIDFEDVETGELMTNIPGREPFDMFHSRLEISPDGNCLLNRGWVWHPLDFIQSYNIQDCLDNPKLLDGYDNLNRIYETEICTASFINSKRILIGSSDENFSDEEDDVIDPHTAKLPLQSIAIYDLENGQLSTPANIKYKFGSLFAINENLAWDMYQFPKIIDLHTGEIVAKDESINSGKQRSAIYNHIDKFPQIVFNYHTKNIVIAADEKIYVLIP